jgi:hypothetical protein
MYISSRVKYPLSSDFNATWILLREFRKILRYQISWKSFHWESSCSMRTDRRADITKLVVAFRNFPNALNKNVDNLQLPKVCLPHAPCEKLALGDGLVFSSISPVNHQPKLPSRSISAATRWPAAPYSHHPAPERVRVYPCIRLLQDTWASTFHSARGRWGSEAWDYAESLV